MRDKELQQWQTETLFKILDYMKKEGITEEELMLNWALTRLRQRGLERQHIKEIVESILNATRKEIKK